MTLTLAALCGFAFLAGFVDAVVGGGGLVQIPALFVLMPQLPPAVLFGTNKFAAIWGTLSAAVQYARRMPPVWRTTLPATAAALPAAFLGARAVSALDPSLLRPLILVLLALVLVYTLWRKDFGALHAPRLGNRQQLWVGLATGALLGFYDGFFGPGTGSFLIFAFVGLFGFSFLAASASAKVVNVATNLAALAWFIGHGQVLYATAVPMALCQIAGSVTGSRLALRRGSGFVRILFMLVVCVLLVRLALDSFGPAPHH